MSAVLLLKEKLRLLEAGDIVRAQESVPPPTERSVVPVVDELAVLREQCSETAASVLTARAAAAREDLIRAGERLAAALGALSVDASGVVAFVAAAEPSDPTDYLREAPSVWIEVGDNCDGKRSSHDQAIASAELRHFRRVHAMQTASASWLEHMHRRKRRTLLDIDEALELAAYRQNVEDAADELRQQLARSVQDEERLGRLRVATVVDDEMCVRKLPDSPKSRRALLSCAHAIRARQEVASDDARALDGLNARRRQLTLAHFPDLGSCRSAWEQFERFVNERRAETIKRSEQRSTKFQLAHEGYAIVQDKVSQRLWDELIV